MKYFLGFLASIVLIVAVVVLILRGFSGGPKKPVVQLANYASGDTTVELTVDGAVNADQTHQGYHITVNNTQAEIQIYQGYQNTITQTKTYTNNQSSYSTFLHALDLAGFAKGNTDPKKADDSGQCATGNRYIYEVQGSTAPNERFWSTTCGGGTFQGKAGQVQALFTKQIPDFETVTGNLNLNN